MLLALALFTLTINYGACTMGIQCQHKDVIKLQSRL